MITRRGATAIETPIRGLGTGLTGDPLRGRQGHSLGERGGLPQPRRAAGTYSNIWARQAGTRPRPRGCGARPAPPTEPAPGGRPPRMMSPNLKRNLLLGVALAAVVAGVILAVLPRGGHHGHPASRAHATRGSQVSDIRLAAEYLGISRGALRRRLRSGETMAEVANATPGRSAGGLVAALFAARRRALTSGTPGSAAERQALARARAQIVAEADRGRERSGPVAAAARYLGLSEGALRARLKAGRSLAQVAAEESKSRAGLIDALVALKSARLRTALTEGAITRGEEQSALSSLPERVAQTVREHIGTSSG